MSLSTETIGFDQLPQAVATLLDEVRDLKVMVSDKLNTTSTAVPDVWFNLTELCSYLPDKPSKSTVYGWVCNRQIPYHKTAKRLSFLKSEIDTWLMSSGKRTAEVIRSTAIASHGYRKGGVL